MHAVTALEPMPDLHDGERTLYNLWRVGGRIAVLDFIGVAPLGYRVTHRFQGEARDRSSAGAERLRSVDHDHRAAGVVAAKHHDNRSNAGQRQENAGA